MWCRRKTPRGRPYYRQDETVEWDNVEPDSDYAAIRAHEISITPLQVDRTDYASLYHLFLWLPQVLGSWRSEKPFKRLSTLTHLQFSETVLVRQPGTLVLSSD